MGRKAQSTLEYALLTVTVIGAFVIMQNYIKRSLMGSLKSRAESIGDEYSPGETYINRMINVVRTNFTANTVAGNRTLTQLPGANTTNVDIFAGGYTISEYTESRTQRETTRIYPLETERWHHNNTIYAYDDNLNSTE